MKYLILFLALIISSLALAADDSAKMIANQQATALKEFRDKVIDKDILPSSPGCPAAGLELVAGKTALTGSLMSAERKLAELALVSQNEAKALLAKANNCGTCKQINAVTPFLISQPAKISPKTMCDGRPIQSFSADFQSDRELEKFTQDILKKKNAEGERVYAGCPDPCAFSVLAGKRTLSNGKIRSTMTVLCGQPRNASVLFAKYNFTNSHAVQWTCQK